MRFFALASLSFLVPLAATAQSLEPTSKKATQYEGFVNERGQLDLRLKQPTTGESEPLYTGSAPTFVPKNFESYATVSDKGALLGIEVVPTDRASAGRILDEAPVGASVIKLGVSDGSTQSKLTDFLFPTSEELSQKARVLVRDMTSAALKEGCENPFRGKEFAASAGISFGVGLSGSFQFSQTWDVEDICKRLKD